jgi:cold shock CspA family protein
LLRGEPGLFAYNTPPLDFGNWIFAMPRRNALVSTLTDMGMGFLRTANVPRDLFFHAKDLEGITFDELQAGDAVSYELETTPHGSVATRVQRDFVDYSEDLWELFADESMPLASVDFSHYASVTKNFNGNLIKYFQANPKVLLSSHPELFEELYAEMLRQDGYFVERIGSWNAADGGVDLIAVRDSIVGPMRVAVQCKRYAHKRRVTAEPIRSLAGILPRFSAHVGVIATTSYFTKPAIEERKQHFFQINLQDWEDIKLKVAALRSD